MYHLSTTSQPAIEDAEKLTIPLGTGNSSKGESFDRFLFA